MSDEKFIVLNVKCGGCVSNIQKGLATVAGVSQVDVEQASGRVVVTGEGLDRTVLAQKLSELGYPEA